MHELKPPDGSHRERRRVGRGLGSGRGKTSGKGVKGQKARAGGGVPPYFEGGQLPLVRKLPYRRGFTNPFRVEYEVVNLDQLEALAGITEVTPDALREAGLIGKASAPVKVLARGSLTKKLTVHAHRFSAAAREAIGAAGGSVVQIGGSAPESTAETKEAGAAARRRRTAPDDRGEDRAAAAGAEAPEVAAESEVPPEPSVPARRRRAAAPAESTGAVEPAEATTENAEAGEDEKRDDA